MVHTVFHSQPVSSINSGSSSWRQVAQNWISPASYNNLGYRDGQSTEPNGLSSARFVTCGPHGSGHNPNHLYEGAVAVCYEQWLEIHPAKQPRISDGYDSTGIAPDINLPFEKAVESFGIPRISAWAASSVTEYDFETVSHVCLKYEPSCVYANKVTLQYTI